MEDFIFILRKFDIGLRVTGTVQGVKRYTSRTVRVGEMLVALFPQEASCLQTALELARETRTAGDAAYANPPKWADAGPMHHLKADAYLFGM